MKNFKIVWIVALLGTLVALVYFILQPKRVYEVLKGDTSKIMQKGGSSITVRYSSEHIDVDTPSRVHITLSTPKSEGVINVEVSPREKALEGVEHRVYQFPLSLSNHEFSIDLEPFSLKEGRFYISLIASIQGERPKVLSIPIEVGDVSRNSIKSIAYKTQKGEKLHIMKAQEEIK